jgi:glycosyltransferase involved in cell wall biosynthesis
LPDSLKTLHLFTQKFPYFGGETFLEAEMPFLMNSFEKIYIYPREIGDRYYAELPDNIVVHNLLIAESFQIRNLIKNQWKWMLKWVISEFLFAPHRFKFVLEFSFHWNRWIGLIREALALQKALQEKESGIYYSYWFNEWATALAICREQGLKGKMVARMHGYDFDEKQNNRGYFVFRQSELKAFDSIHQISEYGIDYVKRKYPWYRNFYINRLGVNDNGIARSGEGTDPFYIVSCSGFVFLKRIPLLIETLSKMNVAFRWIHFGSGQGIEEAKQKAALLLPEGSFLFMGYVSNAEILSFYREQKVDAFINMSELEGIPMSMMEAIASGIPVIGCNVCGVPEIVTEDTGLLLPASPDPGQASMQIANFIKKRCRNMSFREGVKDFWIKNYRASENHSKFIHSIIEN